MLPMHDRHLPKSHMPPEEIWVDLSNIQPEPGPKLSKWMANRENLAQYVHTDPTYNPMCPICNQEASSVIMAWLGQGKDKVGFDEGSAQFKILTVRPDSVALFAVCCDSESCAVRISLSWGEDFLPELVAQWHGNPRTSPRRVPDWARRNRS